MINRVIRTLVALAMCTSSVFSMAQTEEVDRIVQRHDTVMSPVYHITESPILYNTPAIGTSHSDFTNSSITDMHLEKPVLKTELSKPEIPDFRLWKGGHLNVTGMNSTIPGLMSVSTGAVSLTQDFGNVQLSVSALAYKQWTPSMGGIHTMYGVGGLASWRISDNVTLHTFGSYYPAMAGGYVIGGYADIRFSEHWGAELGSTYEYNAFIHQRRFDPIVTPYYRFNNGTKLRIPIGPLVRQGFMELGRMINRH